MIACAGDEIIADPSSIVGSIGVISAGFGFERAIDKLGIERRVYTSGTRKVTLDPFQPENPEDVEHLKSLQREVHDTFIALVRARRGDALSSGEDLFSGLFWTGLSARALGLVDAIGEMRSDLRRRYGDKVELRSVQTGGGFLRRRLGGLSQGAAPRGLISAEEMVDVVTERALWARFGL
ncbi:putative signal peptide peptidase SppA [Methylobrevis pamukkalensis]|uniref:Putative signal peptide peptidase SppA n=1 Tax=Methylobrevis pamukkalensis TaxID=1439726 RepID=A0A1E3GYA3_9HYPH|nr:putative signal peptide peptidase SppA [Methylobrevis pamukkalensis]